MRKLITLLYVFMLSANCLAEETAFGDHRPNADSKIKFSVFLIQKVSDNELSLDAAWEVYSVLMEGEPKEQKVLSLIGALSNFQISRTKMVGYPIRVKGPFIRECSEALSIDREILLAKFSEKSPPDKHVEESALFDARKLFLALGTKELQKMTEQAGTGQPATRTESKSEGSDKPQPEAEGRSR